MPFQALEPAALIPLQLLRRSSARCIMVRGRCRGELLPFLRATGSWQVKEVGSPRVCCYVNLPAELQQRLCSPLLCTSMLCSNALHCSALLASWCTLGVPTQVGDPKQLPATVLSLEASRLNYERSLFQRLQDAGFPVLMLSTQVRRMTLSPNP